MTSIFFLDLGPELVPNIIDLELTFFPKIRSKLGTENMIFSIPNDIQKTLMNGFDLIFFFGTVLTPKLINKP